MNRLQITSFLSSLSASALVMSATAFADGPALPAGTDAAAAPAGAPSGMLGMAPFVLMFAVVYFLMIRPQQKRQKEVQSMIASVKPGDEVIMNSGILGTVTALADKLVTLEVDSNVRVKMLKSQIAQVVKGPIQDLQQNP